MPTAQWYAAAHQHLGLARVNLLTAALRLYLAGPAYTPDLAAHTWASDLSGEVAGGSYPYGGVTIGGRDLADAGDGTGAAVLTCTPVVVDDPQFLVRYGALYADTGDPGTSPLLTLFDLGSAIDAAASPPLVLTFSAGLIRLGPPA